MSGPARRPLAAAVAAMQGQVLAGQIAGDYVGAATDNRNVTPGRLFFALKGERVDGFDFCTAAVAAGAAAVVVPQARGVPAGLPAGFAVIGVEDPRTALAELARAVRAQFRGRVVGVTGSNGKTTTKELVAAALDLRAPALGHPSGDVLRTAGSFNTEIGMPLTILESNGGEAFWVLEMAMRGRGEIAFLADLARPQVGIVTNVAMAHLGRLGSVAEVAKAKGEIWGGLAEGGVGVLPLGEPLLEAEAAGLAEGRKLRFAVNGNPGAAAVRLLEYLPAGSAGTVLRFTAGDVPVVVRLPLPGFHNAANAAAALAVVLALGLDPAPAAAAMGAVVLPPHRSALVPVRGRTVLDDCYNANPASMAAALETVAVLPGAGARAFAVLGDMLELGPEEAALHHGVGALAARHGLAGLVTLGAMGENYVEGAASAGMARERLAHAGSPAEAAAVVMDWTRPGDWVLVKASRGPRLERVIEAMQSEPGKPV